MHWRFFSENYVATRSIQETKNPDASYEKLHTLLLMMRETWYRAHDRYKARGIAFGKFNTPYQQVFRMLRNWLELRSSAQEGVLQDREWVENQQARDFSSSSSYDNAVSEGALQNKGLRLMSFNVLSQHLNEQFCYQWVVLPEGRGDFLRWDIRKKMIVADIRRWTPDIMGLQEVDAPMREYLMSELGDEYELVVTSKRTAKAKSDALLVLLRRGIGVRVVQHDCEYLTPLALVECSAAKEGIPAPKGTVEQSGGCVQRVWFRADDGFEFEFVNTHVAGLSPSLEAVRAKQILGERTCTRPHALGHGTTNCPIIIVGDLNGVKAEAEHVFEHLTSAYDHPNAMQAGGPVVTAHNDVYHKCGELDRIMVSRAWFRVVGVAQIPVEERLVPHREGAHPLSTSMPGPDWPSDHISLVAHVVWRAACEEQKEAWVPETGLQQDALLVGDQATDLAAAGDENPSVSLIPAVSATSHHLLSVASSGGSAVDFHMATEIHIPTVKFLRWLPLDVSSAGVHMLQETQVWDETWSAAYTRTRAVYGDVLVSMQQLIDEEKYFEALWECCAYIFPSSEKEMLAKFKDIAHEEERYVYTV